MAQFCRATIIARENRRMQLRMLLHTATNRIKHGF